MTSSNSALNVLNDVIAVNLHVSIWTGRKMLEDSDLSLSGETPPREIINLGSKHTTDPKALKVFHTLKRRAERLCLSVGIPFLGGYAIPTSKADDVAKELAKIMAQFEVEKQKYLQKHADIQDDWISKFPAYEAILRKALTETCDVEKRINAAYSMFQIKSAQLDSSIDTGLSSQVESLSGSLEDDVLKNAKKLLESLTGAIRPSQTNVNSLKKLREKVEGLAFLNSRFDTLIEKIVHIEQQMPLTGKLSIDETNLLSGLLHRMSTKANLTSLMNDLTTVEQDNVQPQQSFTPTKNDSEIDLSNDCDFGDFEAPQKSMSPTEKSVFF